MKLVQTDIQDEGYDGRNYHDDIYESEKSPGVFVRVRFLNDSMGTDHLESIVEVTPREVQKVTYEPVGRTTNFEVNIYD